MTDRDKSFLKIIGVVLMCLFFLTLLLLPFMGHILFAIAVSINGFAP